MVRLIVRGYVKRSFSDPVRLQQLEAILHPRIRAEILTRIAACTQSAYVIVDVPLLFEKGYTQLFERILVIDCLPEQQRRCVYSNVMAVMMR